MLWNRTSRSPIASRLSPVPAAAERTTESATVASDTPWQTLRRSCHGHAVRQQTNHELTPASCAPFATAVQNCLLLHGNCAVPVGLLGPPEHNLGMHSMDLPRGRLDRSSGQPGEPAGETDFRATRWAPDGRARPPAELLDNLRLRLSQLADNHPSAPRRRHAQRDYGEPRGWPEPRGWGEPRDWGESRDWGDPRDCRDPRDRGEALGWRTSRDWDAPDDWNAPGSWDGQADWDAPEDRGRRSDQDAWPGAGEAAIRHLGSPADQHPDADSSQAGHLGGLADAIRAASRFGDAFPASPGPGVFGEVSWSGSWGDTEPYRPWFMGGDPWSPWWATDD
jgi:hypothetical protein